MATRTEEVRAAIDEFSRVQKYYMLLRDGKTQDCMDELHQRYVDLQGLLESAGVNLARLDRLND